MTDIRELALALVTETLHGAPPIKYTMQLAEAVLELTEPKPGAVAISPSAACEAVRGWQKADDFIELRGATILDPAEVLSLLMVVRSYAARPGVGMLTEAYNDLTPAWRAYLEAVG